MDIKFKRNNIRHNIYPKLNKSAPYLVDHLLTKSIFYKEKFQSILASFDYNFKKYNIYIEQQKIIVPKRAIANLNRKENLKIFIYWLFRKFMNIKFRANISKKHWLKCYQFISSGKSFGKFYLTQQYLILINRDNLVFSIALEDHKKLVIPITHKLKWYNSIFKIELNKINKSNDDINNIFLNKTNGIYVRNWVHGDRIKINTKNIHHKLLSNIFINNKLSVYEKLIQPVVCNKNNDIIWLPGLMKPHITTNDKNKLLKISWKNLK